MAGLIHTHAPLKERPLHVRLYERFAFLFKGHRMNRFLFLNRRVSKEVFIL